jgi:hypothetical protein|uniref:Uncharacterized protein n=1 Tax=Prasinoderma singulare TaxID=676789 RepID=A0A7S3FD71_9VIRI|mmetsp:Transcript_18696/g.58079  ORF Transcript_18696/g.58079 Transcript_18696/m.58079 type:complete len:212 (+) Transcript_18696:323-958(+)
MSFGRLARLQGAAAAAAQAAVSTWRPVPLAALAGAGVLPSRGFATVFGNFSQYNEPEGGWARAEEQSRRQEVAGKGVPGGRRGEDDVAADQGANVKTELNAYNFKVDTATLHKSEHFTNPGRVPGGISQRDYSNKKPVFMSGARRRKLKAWDLEFRRYIKKYNATFKKGALARRQAVEDKQARKEAVEHKKELEAPALAWAPKLSANNGEQ